MTHDSLFLEYFRDYTDFLEDLEEDPHYRQNINIYKGTCTPDIFGIDSHLFLTPLAGIWKQENNVS